LTTPLRKNPGGSLRKILLEPTSIVQKRGANPCGQEVGKKGKERDGP